MPRQPEASKDLGRELAALARLETAELRVRYAALFGQPTRSGNRDWLIRKLAWRMQARVLGGLSELARHRAAELADVADLRASAPRPSSAPGQPVIIAPVASIAVHGDDRLPPLGSVIVREHRGVRHEVRVMAAGFEYQQQVYASLSAVAKAISGSHINGFRFFGLQSQGA